MNKVTVAALALLAITALQHGAAAQGTTVAPATSVAAPAAMPVQDGKNAWGQGVQCQTMVITLQQMQADITALRSEIAVMHQQLTDMQDKQKPAFHSVADVPGKN